MRILLVAPLVTPIDERGLQIGGAQVLVADLARGLAKAGHSVTLAAADGSFVSGVAVPALGIDAGALHPAVLGPRSGGRSDDVAQHAAFSAIRRWIDERSGEFDVIHAHAYDAPAFELLRGAPIPVAHTLHLLPNDPAVVEAARRADDAAIVAVSESQARAWRAHGVTVRTVVHNGIDVAAIRIGGARRRYLLYAGRISPEKGVDTALDVAERLGRAIALVGGVYDAAYYAASIAPRVRHVTAIDERAAEALYLGPRPRHEVHELMAHAQATLMPVRWDEPFGLVAVESLAAGTPVVGSRRGGLTEIVDDRVGALEREDDVAALAAGVERAARIDPEVCRLRAQRFDVSVMVDAYVSLYADLAGRGPGADVFREGVQPRPSDDLEGPWPS